MSKIKYLLILFVVMILISCSYQEKQYEVVRNKYPKAIIVPPEFNSDYSKYIIVDTIKHQIRIISSGTRWDCTYPKIVTDVIYQKY